MFHVYVIINQNDRIYTGYTSDLENRLKRHNGKLKNKSTSYMSKNKGVWKLIYSERFETRIEALKREKQLKSYQGRRFIRSIVNKK